MTRYKSTGPAMANTENRTKNNHKNTTHIIFSYRRYSSIYVYLCINVPIWCITHIRNDRSLRRRAFSVQTREICLSYNNIISAIARNPRGILCNVIASMHYVMSVYIIYISSVYYINILSYRFNEKKMLIKKQFDFNRSNAIGNT